MRRTELDGDHKAAAPNLANKLVPGRQVPETAQEVRSHGGAVLHELFITMIRRRQGAAAGLERAPAGCDAGAPGRAPATAGHR